MSISTHLNHLIQGTWEGCQVCSGLFEEQQAEHYRLHGPKDAGVMPNCFVCRLAEPRQWAETFIADTQAEFRTSVDEFAMTPEEYHSELDMYVREVQAALMKRGSEVASLGEGEMKQQESTAARLVAEAEAMLAKSDTQLATEIEAQAQVADQQDAADLEFATAFKNGMAEVNEGMGGLVLPAGQYPLRVVACTYRLSTEHKRPQLVVTLEVGKGKYAGTLVTKYLTLSTTDKGRVGFWKNVAILGIEQDAVLSGWTGLAKAIAALKTPLWGTVGEPDNWQGKLKTNLQWLNPLPKSPARSTQHNTSDGGE